MLCIFYDHLQHCHHHLFTSIPRRTYSRVVYEPDLGLFRISVNRGNHFVSMGHTLHGQIYLYPEEALFLVDRGSLLAEYRGVDMTVQQMWSVYLQQAEQRQRQEFAGAARAMDLYVTYAYLKRLGFVVTRPGTYHNAEGDLQSGTKDADQNQVVRSSDSWAGFLWSTVVAMWRRRTKSLFHALGLWFAPWSRLFSSGLDKPLVSNNDHLTYGKVLYAIDFLFIVMCYLLLYTLLTPFCYCKDEILEKIQIIPSIRLASVTDASQPKRATVDFEVYKPAGAFKKRQPGIPDYRVVVVEYVAMGIGSVFILHLGSFFFLSNIFFSCTDSFRQGRSTFAIARRFCGLLPRSSGSSHRGTFGDSNNNSNSGNTSTSTTNIRVWEGQKSQGARLAKDPICSRGWWPGHLFEYVQYQSYTIESIRIKERMLFSNEGYLFLLVFFIHLVVWLHVVKGVTKEGYKNTSCGKAKSDYLLVAQVMDPGAVKWDTNRQIAIR